MHLSTEVEKAPFDCVATSISPWSVTMVARPARLAIRIDTRCFHSGAVLGGGPFILRHRERVIIPLSVPGASRRSPQRTETTSRATHVRGPSVESTFRGRGETRRSRGWDPRKTKCQERVIPTVGWTQYGEEGPLRS